MLVLPRSRVRQARARHGGHAHRPDRHPEPHLAHPPSRRTPRQAPKAQPPNRPRLLRRDGRLRGSGAETRERHRRRAEPRVRRGVPLPRPGPTSPPHPATTPRRARDRNRHEEEEDEWDALLAWFGLGGGTEIAERDALPAPKRAGFPRFQTQSSNSAVGATRRTTRTRPSGPNASPRPGRRRQIRPNPSESKSKRQIQSEGPAAAAAAQGGPVRAPAPDVLGCHISAVRVWALERPPASGGTRSDELGD